MAIIRSSYFVATENGLSYEDRSPRALKSGELVPFRGTVTVSSNLALADVIRLISVPKGARLKDFNHEWGDLDGGTTLVMTLGWESADPDAFIDATAGATIYQAADSTAAGNSISNLATEIVFDNGATSDNDFLSFTVTTAASSLAATRTITFAGTYYIP